VIFVSATPGPYEQKHSAQVVEQIIRPTGLVDPAVEVRPIEGQTLDVIEETKKTIARGDRVLVTTLTKKLAEELSEYLADRGIRTRYLHSEIQTLERTEIIRELPARQVRLCSSGSTSCGRASTSPRSGSSGSSMRTRKGSSAMPGA